MRIVSSISGCMISIDMQNHHGQGSLRGGAGNGEEGKELYGRGAVR